MLLCENCTKLRMYSFITGIFCACVIISNILATKNLKLGFIIFPCSILIYPVLFIINDVLSEIYGFEMAKDVIYLGFIVNILSVILYCIAIVSPSNSPTAPAFETILGFTPRLFIANLCSYSVANLLNSKVLVMLKNKNPNSLFLRCMLSTALGELADSIIFISIAFIGVFSIDVILTMITCQVIFKVLYELIMYPATRKIIFFIRTLDDGELEGKLSSV